MLNRNNIKIGWVPVSLDSNDEYNHDLDLLYYEPDTLSVQNNGLISQCPAHTSFVKNFFVIRAPFDLKLEYNEKENYVFSENLTQDQYNRFIFPRFQDRGIDNKLLVTVKWSLLFVADEPCTLEVYPAFMHEKMYNVSIGSYDCYSWQRPIDFTFEIQNIIDIKRGDPLYYISFRTPKNKTVKFTRLEWDDQLKKAVQQCNLNKIQRKISWPLIKKGGNFLRPKRFIK